MNAFGSYCNSATGNGETCLCGRTFHQPSAFTNHKRTCAQSRKQLISALDKAKQIWAEKKRKRDHLQLVATSTATPATAQSMASTAMMPPDNNCTGPSFHDHDGHIYLDWHTSLAEPFSDAESKVSNNESTKELEGDADNQYSIVIILAESG
jgi:hypothetical protein